MTLRTVEWQDEDGRKWLRGIPEHVPDSQASFGVPLGPPPLSSIGLPKEVEVRLHNQLYSRGIFSSEDARRRLPDVKAALNAALQVDVNTILVAYEGEPDGT